jgi:N-acyl-D-aspartate/D-glutamate deacylase
VYDLLIRGGTVVDGTGAPAVTADVAVDGGLIVDVGRVDSRAHRVVDADGLLVMPGFVDVHTHFDGQATWDPHLTPSCWHGVTTAVLGNCGIGFAPARPDGHDWLIELMEGVEDIPGSALAEGIQWDWESFPEYLDALDRTPRAIDIGTHVPHAAVRAYVMGRRAHEDANADELEQMRAIVVDAMRAGALGVSTGRTRGHRDLRGRPVPGTFAPEVEVATLLAAMAEAGHGVFELVPAGIGGIEGGDPLGSMDTELEWMVELSLRTPNPITFLVMESNTHPDLWRPWFDAVRDANARGARLRPQVASRCFGVLMGHQSRMNPFRYTETYPKLAPLPIDERMVRLRDPEVRATIIAEAKVATGAPYMDRLTPDQFDHLFPLGDPLDYEPTADRSIASTAARTRRDPWEVTYDTLLEADGREFLLHPYLNYGRGSYDGLYEMLRDPMTVQGLGDGGAHCAIVCDASMTTFLLTHWVRDRTRGPRLLLETAVRRLTADPATLYGLDDRGTLTPGKRADVNLVDFDALRLRYPERVTDLPAGAGRLVQRADGYVATIVAGETVVDGGELTDAMPGRLIRGGASRRARVAARP